MIKYVVAFLASFAVLVFLKFCEGSPFRSWKSVFLTGIPLALGIGYYFNHAFPRESPPLPQVQKAAAYRLGLERTWRHIAGVDKISITGATVQVDFADSKPLTEVKSLARQFAGNASFFLRTNNQPIPVKVRISVRGAERYELDYARPKVSWQSRNCEARGCAPVADAGMECDVPREHGERAGREVVIGEDPVEVQWWPC